MIDRLNIRVREDSGQVHPRSCRYGIMAPWCGATNLASILAGKEKEKENLGYS
jgi:hypothetical protein